MEPSTSTSWFRPFKLPLFQVYCFKYTLTLSHLPMPDISLQLAPFRLSPLNIGNYALQHKNMANRTYASPDDEGLNQYLHKYYIQEEGIRKDFYDHLAKLTHTGKYAPTKESPEIDFDEETRDEIFKDLIADVGGLEEALWDWLRLCDNNEGEVLQRIKESRMTAAEERAYTVVLRTSPLMTESGGL